MSNNIQVRSATKDDAEAIIALIQELADFERASHEVVLTPTDIRRDGFGNHPAFSAWLAEDQGKIIGLAVLYPRYSTWKGKTLYLEDLIVTASARGKGAGKALLMKCKEMAIEGGYARFEWQVLDWNTTAIEFYKSLNVVLDEDWINCKMLLR